MEFSRKSVRTLVGLITFALLLAWALFRPWAAAGIWRGIVTIVTPFIFGVTFAFLVNLLLRPVEATWDRVFRRAGRRQAGKGRWANLKRPVSLAVSVVLIGAAIFVLMFIVLPEVVRTVVFVAEMTPEYAARLETWRGWLQERLAEYDIVLPQLRIELDSVGASVRDWITQRGPAVLATTLGFTTSVVNGIFNVVIGVVLALYILADKERLLGQMQRTLQAFLPEQRARTVVHVANLTHDTFAKFITGQLTDALIVGLLCYIGMIVLSIPHAGAVSVLVAVTTIIPVIGVLIGTVVAALLIVVTDPMKALWFLIFIIVLQQFESNVIYPRVVGKSVGLPGLWVLVAITVGGALFGILGMLMAVPTFSVMYTLVREAVAKRLQHNNG